MSKPGAEVQADFDRIARAIEDAGREDELRPFERALLGFLPARCGRVLEVGCGHGALTRRVAARAESVLALDLSPEMVRVARARSAAWPNVEYCVADVAETELPDAAFDVVLSAATLHHLPLAPTVRRLAGCVRPGGRLVIQDVVTRPGLRHLPANALGFAVRLLSGRRRATPLAALYDEHGRGERYLRPDEAVRSYRELLPGARVVHHLEWRYTMVWERPAS
jgi:SAM-dependent methyltransferase